MKNKNLNTLLSKHSVQIINHLLRNNMPFSLQCKTSSVKFNPPLPREITKDFHPIIDFILAGFTFDSIEVWEDDMSFEAGFGKDNFSTCVIIPFDSIIQIYLPSTNSLLPQICVYMNALNLLDLAKEDEDAKWNDLFGNLDIQEESEDSIGKDLLESSKKAILSNPNNKFR